MIRYTGIALVGMAAVVAMADQAWAADATLRTRNGNQTFTGNVIDFDGKAYAVESGIFGTLYLDARLYECISGACPGAPETVEIAPAGSALEKNTTIAPPPANEQVPPALTRDRQLQLFRDFLEWRESEPN